MNLVRIAGKIAVVPKFSHESFGEKFYQMMLAIKRKSGDVDEIPILLSDEMFNVKDFKVGSNVFVEGEYRSCNVYQEGKMKLVLNVFAMEINEMESVEDMNSIVLAGYICKKPTYRKTPLGREIADIMLAVNRVSGKTDYIPLIVWGRNAKIAAEYLVGDLIFVNGRIQSRKYIKKITDIVSEVKTTYEVSVTSMNREVDNVG